MKSLFAMIVALAGCSSLVSDPCQSGFVYVTGECAAMGADGTQMPPPKQHVSGTVQPTPVDPIDPLVCEAPAMECHGECLDMTSDPANCGHCDRGCQSGICESSHCIGDLSGHIFAIGHDYFTADPAMDRVLGNAIGAGGQITVRVGWWRGSAPHAQAVLAAHRGLQQTGRGAVDISLAGAISAAQLGELDAVVIEQQVGDGDAADAAGTASAGALAGFLATGHVVVVLESAGGVSYRYAHGAGLFVVAAPVDATGTQVTVAQPADVTVFGVVSPYLAKASSCGYPAVAAPAAVVVDGAGDAVVMHTVY